MWPASAIRSHWRAALEAPMLAQKRPGLFVYLFGPLALSYEPQMTQGKASAATNQELGNRVPDVSPRIRYDGYFNSFTRSHPEFRFLAIASRQAETLEQMRSAISQRLLPFPIFIDRSGRVARLWHSQQTSRCYFVAADGRLLCREAVDNLKLANDEAYVGYLEAAISSFLAGEPIRKAETASFGCAKETVYYQLPKQL